MSRRAELERRRAELDAQLAEYLRLLSADEPSADEPSADEPTTDGGPIPADADADRIDEALVTLNEAAPEPSADEPPPTDHEEPVPGHDDDEHQSRPELRGFARLWWGSNTR